MSTVFVSPLAFTAASTTPASTAPVTGAANDLTGMGWLAPWGSSYCVLDLGAVPVSYDWVALIGTNLRAFDTVRVSTSVNQTFTTSTWTPVTGNGVTRSGSVYTNATYNSYSNYASYAYSSEKAAGAGVSLAPRQTTTQICMAISLAPENNNTAPYYPAMNYMLYLSEAGSLVAHTNGSAVATIGSYTTGDVLAVEHRGTTAVVTKNGTVIFTWSGLSETTAFAGEVRFAQTGSGVISFYGMNTVEDTKAAWVGEKPFAAKADAIIKLSGTKGGRYVRIECNASGHPDSALSVFRIVVGKGIYAPGVTFDAEMGFEDQSVITTGPNYTSVDPYPVLPTWKVPVNWSTETQWRGDIYNLLQTAGNSKGILFIADDASPTLWQTDAMYGRVTNKAGGKSAGYNVWSYELQMIGYTA